jgi:uncharacterized protein (DUF433 family)
MDANGTSPLRPVVESNPAVLGGTVVFRGTRVPFDTFIEYLEGGESIDTFLDDFPSVERAQAMAALESLHRLATDGTDGHASAA